MQKQPNSEHHSLNLTNRSKQLPSQQSKSLTQLEDQYQTEVLKLTFELEDFLQLLLAALTRTRRPLGKLYNG